MNADIALIDASGRRLDLRLATDPKTGFLLWKTGTLRQVQPSVQIGEATYGSFDPNQEALFVQQDLSGGMGLQRQVPDNDADAKRYHYAEWWDASVPGQGQKGPAVTSLSAPANSGQVSGGFELGGNFYLVLSRRIAKYNAGTLTGVADAGVGMWYTDAATYFRLGAETAGETQTAEDADGGTLSSADVRMAQMIRSSGTYLVLLTRVDVKLRRDGTILSTPAAPRVTTFGTAGGQTVSYKIVGRSTVGTTIASPAGTIATANATIDGTNGVTVTWAGVIGAVAYDVYRTAGGPSQGKISTTSSLALTDSGLAGDGTTAPVADTSLDLPGPVTLSVHADRDGQPGTDVIISATVDGNTVPTAANPVSFRFADEDAPVLLPEEPVWLVLSCDAADSNVGVTWRCKTGDPYTRGASATSTDGGDTWINPILDFYFTAYVRVPARTAFVGSTDGADTFVTTTDGSTFTADTYRKAGRFVVVGNTLVRDEYNVGAVQFSSDGRRWDEALAVGDPTVPVTDLLALAGDTLVVCKQDSLFCVDLGSTPAVVQQVYGTGRSVTGNGAGGCVYKGTAFIPWDGGLLALGGSFSGGFTVDASVGIESLPEWDAPWGQGRHTACAPGRHYLYSAVSTSTGYRLFKASDPAKKRDWHGALASIGTGGQDLTKMVVWDPGGASSPHLFCSIGGTSVADILLPRTANPAADPNYLYDTSTTGDLYHPAMSGLFPLHEKALVAESITFAKATAGDYAETLYDTGDGAGWRRLPGGRVSGTSAVPYPLGETAKVLKRRTRLSNSAASASPIILAAGATYAVRPPAELKLRTIGCTVLAAPGLAGRSLAATLAPGGRTVAQALDAATGEGTYTLIGPQGETYGAVLVLNAQATPLATTAGDEQAAVELSLIQVG